MYVAIAAARLGRVCTPYRFLWQIDDDSEISKPIGEDMITWMQTNDVQVGYYWRYPDAAYVSCADSLSIA
jgi:hypothetical protein